MNNIIMSVDLSTNKVGVAIFYEKSAGNYSLEESRQISLGDSKALLESKLDALGRFMYEYASHWDVGEVITERPTAFGNGIKVAYAVGVLYAVCGRLEIPIKEISPMTVKKEFTGSGKAKKPEMVAKAQELFPDENIGDKDEDRADAIAIGYTQIKQFYKSNII